MLPNLFRKVRNAVTTGDPSSAGIDLPRRLRILSKNILLRLVLEDPLVGRAAATLWRRRP